MLSPAEDNQNACLPYLDIQVSATTHDLLGALLSAAPLPTVLFRSIDGTDLTSERLSELIARAQHHNAAALLADDPQLARALKADGVHISPGPNVQARYEEARDILGGRFIVGASAGKSRHDAMVLAELEADYIAFGAPPVVRDQSKAKANRLGLISWWAEVFEVPCVAFDADKSEEIAELAGAGADFIAISIPAGLSIAEAVAKLNSANEIFSQTVRAC